MDLLHIFSGCITGFPMKSSLNDHCDFFWPKSVRQMLVAYLPLSSFFLEKT